MTIEAASASDGERETQAGLSRRSLIRGAGGLVAATALAPRAALGAVGSSSAVRPAVGDRLFDMLDRRIEAAMKAYAVPGVAVAVLYQGREYVRGYGITNVDDPQPVTGDTLFRIGSTTKTFTGTTAMRLVEQGRLDLDATVRTYLPEFEVAAPSASAQVTVRQVLNHSPGWLGEYLQDFGRGEDALAKFVAGMARLPQLTPPGTTFAYNNAGIVLAGHIIEKVTDKPYETAVRDLVLGPLGLDHSGFFTDELIGYRFAAPHSVVEGKAVLDRSLWYVPRSFHPTGALISSASDQLRWARFHLGRLGAHGTPPLTRASLRAMRSRSGPGGTLYVELEGVGVTWHLRPSTEGVRIVQHGGDWFGQRSGFLFVPDRDFALTVLTNSDGGIPLLLELFADDWALERFAGLTNLPANPQTLPPDQLAPYEGDYTSEMILFDGQRDSVRLRLTPAQGRLRYRMLDAAGSPLDPSPGTPDALVFYRKDHVLIVDRDGKPLGTRADFIRSANGRVKWFRLGGRLNRHTT